MIEANRKFYKIDSLGSAIEITFQFVIFSKPLHTGVSYTLVAESLLCMSTQMGRLIIN